MNPQGGGLIPQHRDYFDFIRERQDETVSQAALRFNAAQKWITVVLAGMKTIEEVEENVKVADYPLIVSDEKLKEIKSRITDSMNLLCTTCGYCSKCPQKIKIPSYMEAYNLSLLKDENETKKRINWFKDQGVLKEGVSTAADCIACGLCETLCTQKLPIIERLKEIALKY